MWRDTVEEFGVGVGDLQDSWISNKTIKVQKNKK